MTVPGDTARAVAPHDLFARLAAALATASRTDRHAIVIVDVDDLTAINRTHGTAAGDGVVDAVWRAVAGALGGDELAARWAGDQFVVFLPGAGRRAARRRARAIVAAVAAPAAPGRAAISASAGVAASPAHRRDERDADRGGRGRPVPGQARRSRAGSRARTLSGPTAPGRRPGGRSPPAATRAPTLSRARAAAGPASARCRA